MGEKSLNRILGIGGRAALPADIAIERLPIRGAQGFQRIKRHAVTRGMHTLMDDGARKVVRGVTSVAEVLSVTQEDMA